MFSWSRKQLLDVKEHNISIQSSCEVVKIILFNSVCHYHNVVAASDNLLHVCSILLFLQKHGGLSPLNFLSKQHEFVLIDPLVGVCFFLFK